jgi:hypothetical protein
MKPGPKPRPIEQRFWALVDKNGPIPERKPELGECWMWKGTSRDKRYGSFYWGPDDGDYPRMRTAHRVAYELCIGPIPAGLEPDHLCENKLCVRPDHLEPVTHEENIRRHYRIFTATTFLRALTASAIRALRGRRKAVGCEPNHRADA